MFNKLKHYLNHKKLNNPQYNFLFDPPATSSQEVSQEVVCFDCETTGLNPKKDKIITLSAIKIRHNEILTSQALSLHIKQQTPINSASIKVHHIRNLDAQTGITEQEAMHQFLHFIGNRPLVGYYLEFDIAMVNQIIQPWLGIVLPNKAIEVSALYYDHKADFIPQKIIDLSFQAILKNLQIPNLGQHDAFSDALMSALIYVKLKQLQAN